MTSKIDTQGKKHAKLKKPNVALVMVPVLGKMTLTTRKMYNVMLYKTQQQIAELAVKGQAVTGQHLFSSSLTELLEASSAGDSDLRTLAKKYLREMRRIEVDWEAPDAKTGVVWQSMGLLSEVDLEIRSGSTWVLWALPPSLLMAVTDPERYTELDLYYMQQLQSYAALALYEICRRYKQNPSAMTSMNPPQWWVNALTSAGPTIDPKTGELKVREFRKLKNESLGKAIEEINTKTDISVELREVKTGKAVTGVQFSIQRNRVTPEVIHEIKVSADLATQAARLDLRLVDLVKILKAGCSEGEMKVGLAKLEARLSHPNLGPIENRVAYLRKLINEDYGLIDVPQSTGHKDASSQMATSEDQPVPEQTWLQKRQADIKTELDGLAADERNRFAYMALSELKEAGLASPSMARKVQAGDWKSGVLLSKAMNAYATERYGENWDVEPAEQQLQPAELNLAV